MFFSALIMRFYWQKNPKFLNVRKIRKYDEECFFEENTFSSFKNASQPSWEGAKDAGGSRPSCFNSTVRCKFQNSLMLLTLHLLEKFIRPKKIEVVWKLVIEKFLLNVFGLIDHNQNPKKVWQNKNEKLNLLFRNIAPFRIESVVIKQIYAYRFIEKQSWHKDKSYTLRVSSRALYSSFWFMEGALRNIFRASS